MPTSCKGGAFLTSVVTGLIVNERTSRSRTTAMRGPTWRKTMRCLAIWSAAACVLQGFSVPSLARDEVNDSPPSHISAEGHAWRPPFGLDRVGRSHAAIEADAIARPDTAVNPVDLGTILVPNGWLLLGPEQAGVVD